ncbi:MAG: hypothetical protein AAB646_01370 [Patescibacteria group bacterium]
MKIFTKVAAVLFAIIGLLHLARLVYGWEAEIGGLVLPMWASVVALIAAGVIACGLQRESR